jgi:hypothetical protein
MFAPVTFPVEGARVRRFALVLGTYKLAALALIHLYKNTGDFSIANCASSHDLV